MTAVWFKTHDGRELWFMTTVKMKNQLNFGKKPEFKRFVKESVS